MSHSIPETSLIPESGSVDELVISTTAITDNATVESDNDDDDDNGDNENDQLDETTDGMAKKKKKRDKKKIKMRKAEERAAKLAIQAVVNSMVDSISGKSVIPRSGAESVDKLVISTTTDVEIESDNDDDDENDDGKETKKQRNKKRNKKKKGKAAEPKLPISRCLGGFTDYYRKYGQTDPPTRLVSDLFQVGEFPEGEIQPHGSTKKLVVIPADSKRVTEEEKRFWKSNLYTTYTTD